MCVSVRALTLRWREMQGGVKEGEKERGRERERGGEGGKGREKMGGEGGLG